MHAGISPLWTEFFTRASENITLPKLRLRAVKTWKNYENIMEFCQFVKGGNPGYIGSHFVLNISKIMKSELIHSKCWNIWKLNKMSLNWLLIAACLIDNLNYVCNWEWLQMYPYLCYDDIKLNNPNPNIIGIWYGMQIICRGIFKAPWFALVLDIRVTYDMVKVDLSSPRCWFGC